MLERHDSSLVPRPSSTLRRGPAGEASIIILHTLQFEAVMVVVNLGGMTC